MLTAAYPSRARRLAPDFSSRSGLPSRQQERGVLPTGKYHVTYTRGPEYRVLERDVNVATVEPRTEKFQLKH